MIFIVNPAAGHGRGGKRFRALRALLPEAEVLFTERSGHARELARAAAEGGAQAVVAVGGDGTVGEVADGLLAAPGCGAALATFPAGSGCDFARHWLVPSEPGAWLESFRAAKPRRIDAARASWAGGTRHFLNVAALGLAGDAAEAVARRGKPLGGALSYLVEGLLAIVAARARPMRITTDGAVLEGRFHLVAAANTSSFGGGMLLAPDADAGDGLLDLLTIGDLSRLELMGLLARSRNGSHLGRPGVRLIRAKRIEVEAQDATLNLDGDAEGRAPAVFEVLPGILPVLI